METNAKNLMKKIIASLIVFAMLLLNGLPILGNFSFAAEDPMSNVEVNAYFSADGSAAATSLVCDVNNETVKVNFDVSVRGGGYFKSGAIKFGNDLNFKLNPDANTIIKNNKLLLPEVSSKAVLNVSIPISFDTEKEFSEKYLNGANTVKFTGEYVDEEGILYYIEKNLNLNLNWKEETQSKLTYETIKNLNFEKADGTKGKILQTRILLSSENKNKLPVRSTELEIDIPQCEGLQFSEIRVDSDKLLYSQGREDYQMDFSSTNYKVVDGKVFLSIANNEKYGTIHKSIGEDSYIITFIYVGEPAQKEMDSTVRCNVYNYGNNNEYLEMNIKYKLNESVGETVQYIRENKELPISRGYLMANSLKENYEILYTRKDILSINRSDLVSELEISDIDEYFIDKSESNSYSTEKCAFYKKTEFSKENLVHILGKDGKVQILNMNDEVLGQITFDMETDDNGTFVVEYSEPISQIKIRFSDPVIDGNISVVNTKYMKTINFTESEIREFGKLVSHARGTATYNEGITTDLGIVESTIEISDTISKASITLEKSDFSTVSVNEGVNLKVSLNNNDDSSDLYRDPVFEIRLPEVIREVSVRNIDMFYSNGELTLSNIETFANGNNQVIRIGLKGCQTSYGINKETNGTIISLDLDLKLDELSMNGTDNVELYYYNVLSTRYENETNWSLVVENDSGVELNNGSSKFPISYRAPSGLINAQATETQETMTIEEEPAEEPEPVQEPEPVEEPVEEPTPEEKPEEEQKSRDRVVSIKQGAQADLLETGTPAKLATMFISVMNGTDKSYTNFRILGRLPFVGNKDIQTGEDLGTTIDTILDTGIKCSNDVVYQVYYSVKADATDDLYDESNQWRTDYFKLGGVKSYLIVFEEGYTLEPNEKIEFEYDYVIPANLKEGDAFYGTYASYFTEVSTGWSSQEGADKVGYETEQKANIEASITCGTETIRELSDVDFLVNLSNLSNATLINPAIKVVIPDGFIFKGIEGNGISAELDGTTIIIHKDYLEAGTVQDAKIILESGRFDEDEKPTLEATISGDNLHQDFTVSTGEVNTEKIYLSIDEVAPTQRLSAGNEYTYHYLISNVSDETLNNIVVRKTIEGDAYFVNAKIPDVEFEKEYAKGTKEVTWEIATLEPGEGFNIEYVVTCDYSKKNISAIVSKIHTVTMPSKENISEYKTEQEVTFSQANFYIEELNSKETSYSDAGNTVTYQYKVTNLSNFDVNNLTCIANLKGDARLSAITVEMNGQKRSTVGDNISLITLPKNASAVVTVTVNLGKYADEFVSCDVDFKAGKAFEKKNSTYTILEDETSYRNLTGIIYIDKNNNKVQDYDEEVLPGTLVELYSSDTNKKIASTVTDISGRYVFDKVVDGQYYVKFNYDDSKYLVNAPDSKVSLRNSSNVLKINENYITDNIEIKNRSVSNVDLQLTDTNVFDMKVDMEVEKMTVNNSAENTEFVSENKKLSKVDIDAKLVNETKVLVAYKIIVTNQGEIEGNIIKLVDYLPDNMQFDSSLNPEWYMEADGNIYTRTLKDDVIKPGETRELKLVLVRVMDENSTGLIHNSVEIAEATNEKGIRDIDSIPGNKLEEDDFSSANTLIGIKTGMDINRLPIVLTVIVIAIPISFLVWKTIDKRRYV